jgi:hypothetical protein
MHAHRPVDSESLTRKSSIMNIPLLVALFAILIANVAQAGEEDVGGDAAVGKHRIDLTYLKVSTFDTNVRVNVFLFGYTRSFSSGIRTGAQTGLLLVSDSPSPESVATETTTERYLADTTLTFQYDFAEDIAASPWVPDTLGLNAQLTLPTGNADNALGIDAWFLSVGAGWGGNPFWDLWLVPAVGYEFTFTEGNSAIPVSNAYATLPIIWVAPSGFWIGYSLTLRRDIEANEWLDDHGITVGKMFRNGFGLSLDIGDSDRVGPVSIPDDEQLVINFHYQFGN